MRLSIVVFLACTAGLVWSAKHDQAESTVTGSGTSNSDFSGDASSSNRASQHGDGTRTAHDTHSDRSGTGASGAASKDTKHKAVNKKNLNSAGTNSATANAPGGRNSRTHTGRTNSGQKAGMIRNQKGEEVVYLLRSKDEQERSAVNSQAKMTNGCVDGSNACKFKHTDTEGGKADVDATESTDEKQKGKIDAYEFGATEGPFYYETTCKDGQTTASGACKSHLDNRKGWRMECDTDENRISTCWDRTNRLMPQKIPFNSVQAVSDSDGVTTINKGGIKVLESKCRDGRGGYRCNAQLANAEAKSLKGTSSTKCYTPSKRGDPEILVSQARYQYISDPNNPSTYKMPHCGLMSGYLTFKNFQGQDLKDVFNRLGLQITSMINPVGKMKCDDPRVNPMLGPNSECYYANLCDTAISGKATDVLVDSDVPCDEDARNNRRVRFQARVCPPDDMANVDVCTKFTKSATSGYDKKKGDVDLTVRTFLRDTVSDFGQWNEDWETILDAIKRSNFIGSFTLDSKGRAAHAQINKILENNDALNKFFGPTKGPQIKLQWGLTPKKVTGNRTLLGILRDLYYAVRIGGKGKLVGCQSWTQNYNAGEGTSALIEAGGLAAGFTQGGLKGVLGQYVDGASCKKNQEARRKYTKEDKRRRKFRI